MSLFGALSASLTSLTAQSRAVNVISNNIANLSTTGFKGTSVSFATLVAGNVGGGVLDALRQDINAQGAVNSTGVGTDLAMQGQGFFVVKDVSGNTMFTRAGSFRTDSTGRMVNEAGYILQGWPLDLAGRLPGESGNVNTTSNQDLDSLVPISTSDITGSASPTSEIKTKINLKSEENLLEGAGQTADPLSSDNANNSATDIIIPQGFALGATITVTNTLGPTTFVYGGIAPSTDLTVGAGVAGATSANATFTGFTNGDSFTIQAGSLGAVTYTFQTNSNTNLNQFKNLNELASIINSTDGLRARVDGGILYVAADNPQDAIDFTDVTGTMSAQLGLADVASSNLNRFASLGDLAEYVNASNGLEGIVNTPTAASTLKIYNTDPTDSVTFSGTAALLTEFGLVTTAIPPVYDAASVTGQNMAGGTIAPDFSRTVTVYNSLGEGVDLRLAFVKIADTDSEQTWAVELFSVDPEGLDNGRGGVDGLLAYGTISFNGDGTLKSVNGPTVNPGDKVFSIAGEIVMDPAGGASAQELTLNLGTAGDIGVGKADGMSQFAGQYNVDVLSQNGFPTGRLQSLQVDSEGYVTAVFDNSLTSRVYKLPVAYFPNPNGLSAESGNAYSQNITAGEVTLGQVGNASVGTIVPGALEVSTSELGEELTNLIISQQSYSASSNVLRKVNELFDELKNL